MKNKLKVNFNSFLIKKLSFSCLNNNLIINNKYYYRKNDLMIRYFSEKTINSINSDVEITNFIRKKNANIINKKTPNSRLRIFDHILHLKLLNYNIFFSSNPFILPSIKRILITFSLINFDSERSIIFVRMLWLVEQVFLKKGFIKNYNSYRFGRNERCVNFCLQNTLNKILINKTIYFFILFVYQNFKKKLFVLPRELTLDSLAYTFIIRDINVFPGYIETFFKWPYPFFLRIEFTKINSQISHLSNKYLLQEFGFIV